MTVHLFINIVIHVLFIYMFVCLFTCVHMYICTPLSVTQLDKHLKVMHDLHTVDVTECDLSMWLLPLHIQPAGACERKQSRI